MLKSDITVRIVRLPAVLLGLLVLELTEQPSYLPPAFIVIFYTVLQFTQDDR